MSQHQGGPTGYSTHSPFTSEYESPTSQAHRYSIGMGAGRHDRTRARNTSEPVDLSVDDRWRIESVTNASDAYSQPGRHRFPANHDYEVPLPPPHAITNNTVQHGGRDRLGSHHTGSRSIAFAYGRPTYEPEETGSQSVSVSAPTHSILSGQDPFTGRHALPVSHQASSVPRGSSSHVTASHLRASEGFHPSSVGTRSRAAPLSSPQFMRRDSVPELPSHHTPLTRTSSYPSMTQGPSRVTPLSSSQSSSRDRLTSSFESAPGPPLPAGLVESIRQPIGSQDSSRLVYFDAQTLSSHEAPASEALAGVTSSTSESTGSSPDREIVTPQAEEYHASTSEQSPSNPNYAVQGPTNTNLPRRKKTSNACHFCRRRKLKCDAGRPCGNCAKRSQSCEYDEKIKRRGPGKRTKDPATAPPPRPTRRRANTSHSASGPTAGEELGMPPPVMAPGVGQRPGPYVPPGPSPPDLSLDPAGPTVLTTRNVAPMHRLNPESVSDFAGRGSRPNFESVVDRDSISDQEVVPQLGLAIPDTLHRTWDPDTSRSAQYSYSQTRPSRTSSASTGPTSPQSYSSESMASQPVYSPQHHHISQQYYPAPHAPYGADFLSSQQGSSASRVYQYIETPREGYDPSADRRFREPSMEEPQSPPGLGSHRGH